MRKLTLASLIFLYLYSVIIEITYRVLVLLGPFSKSIRFFLRGRDRALLISDMLKEDSLNRYHARIVFFCSSAGEYEQAIPIIRRMEALGCWVGVFLFSESGMRFIRARGEQGFLMKAPLDSIWRWRTTLQTINPDLALVVRHELWPGFLGACAEICPAVLIDGSNSRSIEKSKIARYLKKQLLRFLDCYYVVEKSDGDFYAELLCCPRDRIVTVGDSKYDRVVERITDSHKEIEHIRFFLDRQFGSVRRLIVGSAWREDVIVALDAWKNKCAEPCSNSGWQLVLVPHEPDQEMIQWIIEQCYERSISRVCFSEIQDQNQMDKSAIAPVLIVDKVGMLAELYASGQLAFIGGALHYQVHNVLEPAAHGLALAFGSKYQNSKEATLMVNSGLAHIVHSSADFEKWWESRSDSACKDQDVLDQVKNLCGASDRIIDDFVIRYDGVLPSNLGKLNE